MKSFWSSCVLTAVLSFSVALVSAQSPGPLSPVAPAKIEARRGETVEAKTRFSLAAGYHTNSNTPSEDYLIPLRLTWEKGLLEAVEVRYPKPQMEKYSFSPKPLSVFTGDFEITTRFRVPPSATPGPGSVYGKLRYQACTSSACLPPKTVEVRLPVSVR